MDWSSELDPTTTLKELRELCEHDDPAEVADPIIERVTALDGWLSDGGFLPEQWQPATHSGRPRRTSDGHVLEGVTHGRRRSYNMGCKCVPCTAANRLKRNLTPAEIEEYTHG